MSNSYLAQVQQKMTNKRQDTRLIRRALLKTGLLLLSGQYAKLVDAQVQIGMTHTGNVPNYLGDMYTSSAYLEIKEEIETFFNAVVNVPLSDIEAFEYIYNSTDLNLRRKTIGEWNNAAEIASIVLEDSREKYGINWLVGSKMGFSNVTPWSGIDAIRSGDSRVVLASEFGDFETSALDIQASNVAMMADADPILVTFSSPTTEISHDFKTFVGLKVPSEESVTALEVPLMQGEVNGSQQNIFIVGDIILETIGITAGRDGLITTLIESEPQFAGLLNDLLAKISTKKWEELVPTCEDIFRLLVGAKIWQTYSKKMQKQISARLALRCVPIVGWIYCVTALIFSIKKNHHRFS